MMRRALFLDRDGVINIDHAYVHRQQDFHFVDGIFDLVRHATENGYLVVVVTNQAGIGRGYYTEDDFHALMAWVRASFAAQGGALDGVYFCPDHPEHGIGAYRRQTAMRKPGPGMILQACAELDIDPAMSLLIGDNLTDLQAGQAAGVGINLLFRQAPDDVPQGIRAITDLRQAIPLLVGEAA